MRIINEGVLCFTTNLYVKKKQISAVRFEQHHITYRKFRLLAPPPRFISLPGICPSICKQKNKAISDVSPS